MIKAGSIKRPGSGICRAIEAGPTERQAATFDGSNDHGVLASTSIAPTGALSIAAWIKVPSNATTRPIASKNAASPNYGWMFQVTGAKKLDFVVSHNGTDLLRATSSVNVDDDVLKHVAGTFDPSTGTVKVYINGVEADSETNAAFADLHNSSGTFYVGRYSSSYYRSILYDLRMYASVLTASQVAFLANQGGSNPGLTNIIARWKFDEGTGTVAADSSGNNHTLNLINITQASFWANTVTI